MRRSLPPTLGDAALRDYGAWVQAQHGAGVEAFERPDAGFPQRLQQIVGTVEARIACGFLPDELSWPEVEPGEALADFWAIAEFQPYRFKDVPAMSEPEGVVLFVDQPLDAISRSAQALADAIGSASGYANRTMDAGVASDEEIAGAIQQAIWVINVVRDWSVGFAIDEYAARTGCRCLRMENPGYSPFRFALLGQHMPELSDEVPHVRPMLRETHWLERGRAEPRAISWFGADRSAWARWMGRDAFDLFWAGRDFGRLSKPRVSAPPAWHDRPLAWSASAACLNDAAVPDDAKRRLAAALGEQVADDLRNQVWRLMNELAAPGWIARFPDCLDILRRGAGEGRDTKKVVSSWVMRACARTADPEVLLAIARNGFWALDRREIVNWQPLLLFAWAERWAELPANLGAGDAMALPQRRICWDGFLRHSRQCSEPSAEERKAIATILVHPEIWMRCFGAAGPVLRLAAAVSFRHTSVARQVAAEFLRAAGIRPVGGMARLVRQCYPDESAFVARVESLIKQEAPNLESLVMEVLQSWNRRHRWEMWRTSTASLVQRELQVAIRIAEARVAARPQDVACWRLLSVWLAIAGRRPEAEIALREYLSRVPAPSELPGVVAAAAAWRGELVEARRLLERWPTATEDTFVMHFVRALAWQIVGDASAANIELQLLRRALPTFPPAGAAAESFLVWTTAVCLRAGKQELAAELRCRLQAISDASAAFLDEIVPVNQALAAGWSELFATDRAEESGPKS